MRTIPGSTRARAAAGLVAVALVAAGCTADDPEPQTDRTTAPPAASGPAPVEWRECPEVPQELVGQGAPNMSYECATLPVPRDWGQPRSSGTFDIEMIRARSAQQEDRIGSLIINPGGPGGSGVEAAVYLSFGSIAGGVPDEVTRRFDLVGFDPRGVSRSSPVECISDDHLDETFAADPDPVKPDEFDDAVADSRRIAQRCGEEYGEALRYFSTTQTAHDLDAVRAAIGDEKTTYLGYSYGTLLGATYAQLYPDNIRALVLDGAVDPREDLVAASEGQAEGFERALDNFAQWCDGSAECPLAPDTRAAVTDAIDNARSSPVEGAGERDATAGWVFWAVVSTLYSQERWPALAEAIDQLAAGDPGEVFALADAYAERSPDGSYSNLFDANAAVNCADDDSELTVDQVRDLQQQWREEYPLFGAPLAVGVLTCALWPGESDPYPTGEADGAPPILVVGTTGDPATPYESTPRLADMLGVGVVLTWDGEGHTAYPDTPCITEAVNAYLIDLTVPPEDTVCPAR